MTNMTNTIRRALAIFAILGIATFMLAACLGGGGGSGDSSGGGGGGGRDREEMGIDPSNNRAPQTRGSIPDQALTVGGTVTIDLSRYFTDPDGDRLTYTLRFAEGEENRVRASVSGGSLRIQGVTPTRLIIRVVARDPSGSPVYQDVNVSVSADDDDGDGDGDNRAPQTRGSIPDQTLTVGETVTIDLSRYFTDPDGDRLTYSLTFSGGQASQVRASVSGDSLRIQGVTSPGQNVGVTARDPSGGQAYQEVRVAVSAGYAALAIATSPGGGGRYAWQFGYDDSAAAAERDARNKCEGLSGSGGSCRLLGGGAFTNTCYALALSECRSGSCTWGSAGGRTRSEAERAAIAQCERTAPRIGAAGTCRVGTDRYGIPSVTCPGVE